VRVFAVSDLHVDYEENRRWLHNLSEQEYQDDVLILAGDVSDLIARLVESFEALQHRFAEVLFVPGNHELWVHRDGTGDSLAKFGQIKRIAAEHGVRMEPAHLNSLSIVPLLGWYDYSFGRPTSEVQRAWVDFGACRWPDTYDQAAITNHFVELNKPHLSVRNQRIISFSHFLPRIDLMPFTIPERKRTLYPVLGTVHLEQQIRQLGADIHVYGHSHINMRNYKDKTIYINNAFGYPHETRWTARRLVSVAEI
jgi:predicted phosphodiesterase